MAYGQQVQRELPRPLDTHIVPRHAALACLRASLLLRTAGRTAMFSSLEESLERGLVGLVGSLGVLDMYWLFGGECFEGLERRA